MSINSAIAPLVNSSLRTYQPVKTVMSNGARYFQHSFSKAGNSSNNLPTSINSAIRTHQAGQGILTKIRNVGRPTPAMFASLPPTTPKEHVLLSKIRNIGQPTSAMSASLPAATTEEPASTQNVSRTPRFIKSGRPSTHSNPGLNRSNHKNSPTLDSSENLARGKPQQELINTKNNPTEEKFSAATTSNAETKVITQDNRTENQSIQTDGAASHVKPESILSGGTQSSRSDIPSERRSFHAGFQITTSEGKVNLTNLPEILSRELDWFKKGDATIELDMSKLGLETYLSGRDSVQQLNLSDNNLTGLSPIRLPPNLKVLNLCGNPLKQLPDSISLQNDCTIHLDMDQIIHLTEANILTIQDALSQPDGPIKFHLHG